MLTQAPYGAAPLPPTKVGAQCLAAVVLAHHDRVVSLWVSTRRDFLGFRTGRNST